MTTLEWLLFAWAGLATLAAVYYRRKFVYARSIARRWESFWHGFESSMKNSPGPGLVIGLAVAAVLIWKFDAVKKFLNAHHGKF